MTALAGAMRLEDAISQEMAGRTNTREAAMKTMAIRLDDGLHAQLSLIAQLDGISITEVIRSAIERYLEDKRKNPELTTQANQLLHQIEQEVAARKDAIETLLIGKGASSGSRSARRSERKGSEPEASEA